MCLYLNPIRENMKNQFRQLRYARLRHSRGFLAIVVAGAALLILLVENPNDAAKQKVSNSHDGSALLSVNTSQYREGAPVVNKAPTAPLFLVIKVVDGDTIKVDIDGKYETVRMIGVDAPESVDPRQSVQCFGKEAASYAGDILSGKHIQLERDPAQGDRDKYKRLLRYVFLEDGTNVNELLIREGYAHEYTYRIPYKYQKEFRGAELEARKDGRGLWADGVCVK